MLLVKQLFEWRWSRWLLKHSRLHRWFVVHAMSRLDAWLIGAYWGGRGLCPYCGKDHHVADKQRMLLKFAHLKEERIDEVIDKLQK